MPELEKMQAPDFRYQVFAKVFNSPDGKLALAYLEQVFKITVPDYDRPNVVYWQLGRQSAVNYIKNVLTYGDKNNE